MSKERDDSVKQSTICNTCRGTGKEWRPTQRREKGPDGRPVTVTEDKEYPCRTCNGLGEYPMI